MTVKFKDTDPCTDIILDFIAGGLWGDMLGNPIGESNGNYNAFFGHPSSTRDFSPYTLDYIYAFQGGMLKTDPRSTALGRYQFLRKTLKALQGKHALPGSTLFTPELQDGFAVDLLVGRSYKAWWRGAITDAEFAVNLSLEWASLPDPDNAGRSAYDGDVAGNHASTTLGHVYDMLERARAAQKK
jgi:hypothetical protein